MQDKVVLITGSSSGIGEASAIRFSRLGCQVVIHGTDQTRVDNVVERCSQEHPNRIKPFSCLADLRRPDDVKRLMRSTIERHGRLDILVNNAGLFTPIIVSHENAFEIYSDLININLNSVVQLTTLAIPHLKKTKGCIVNISSNLHAKTISGGFAYCTAKAGLTMFTKSIAVDLAPDIRVNSVSPGPIATRMPTRVGMSVNEYRTQVAGACLVNRVGEADEVARVVEFLASPGSAFITGSDFIIDGGSTIKPGGAAMGSD